MVLQGDQRRREQGVLKGGAMGQILAFIIVGGGGVFTFYPLLSPVINGSP